MRLRVTAPARLHFGLLQIDPAKPHCYGGLGLMLQSPSLRIALEPSSAFQVSIQGNAKPDQSAAIEQKIVDTVQRSRSFFPAFEPDKCRFVIENSPRLHSGLGTGTQLACSIASLIALDQLHSNHTGIVPTIASTLELWHAIANGSTQLQKEFDTSSPHGCLAMVSGRGRRSHIGIEGFLSGGWIFDEGQCQAKNAASDALGCPRKVHRWRFPEEWQIVLLLSDNAEGLSGEQEQASFALSEKSTSDIPSQMLAVANSQIAESLVSKSLASFSTAITQYNELAGKLFTHPQEATPNGSIIKAIGKVLRELGIAGFGQTSWGPTMWMVLAKGPSLASTVERLQQVLFANGLQSVTAVPVEVSSTGAMIENLY